MADKKVVRIVIPIDDEKCCAWIDAQRNISMSIRQLINDSMNGEVRDSVKNENVCDYFATNYAATDSNSRKRGRASKKAVPSSFVESEVTAETNTDDTNADDINADNTNTNDSAFDMMNNPVVNSGSSDVVLAELMGMGMG